MSEEVKVETVSEQEQTQSAHQRQRIENSHNSLLPHSNFLTIDSIKGVCQIRCNGCVKSM